MSVETAIADQGDQRDKIFKEMESHPWESDTHFQAGLSAILGGVTDPEQVRNLTLRAQCFYFARKKSIPIDFDAYQSYISSQSVSPSAKIEAPLPSEPAKKMLEKTEPVAQTAIPTAPYPPSFAEIVALIKAGKTVPGCVDIPPTLLTSQATKPVQKKRRKPWEMNISEEEVQGAGYILSSDTADGGVKVIEGTFGDHRDHHIAQELPEDT